MTRPVRSKRSQAASANAGAPSAAIADYRWLIGDEGAKWISQAAEIGDKPGASLVALTNILRRELPAERTHLVLEQVELRPKARDKFTAAGRMFFTRRGYEQATDEVVAAYKARRFPSSQRVADLCCGIGGDLMALAGQGPAIGMDRDPVMALLSQANCRTTGQGTAETLAADILKLNVAEFAAWHIDPDRRPQGRRTTRVELHEPGVDAIERLLSEQSCGGVKLAPAAELPAGWEERAELEWIGRGGECRQLVAWFGDLAKRPGERQATVLSDAPVEPRTISGQPNLQPPLTATIGRYVFEPDAAVLAADLAGALAVEHRLSAITARGGYLTGDQPLADGALACFEVSDVLPYHPQRVRELLTAKKIGRLEIKKRDAATDLEKVRRELRLHGDERATLLLARIGRSLTAILARRI